MSLPQSWVERIFARFTAIFGSQKVGAMWQAVDPADVVALWSEQLARFEPQTLKAALQATIDSGNEWPPTLPEFVETCRRCSLERRAHAPAVMLPRPAPNPEVAQAAIDVVAKTIGGIRPGREWAHKLLARRDAGERLSFMQLQMAQAAVGAGGAE